MTTLYAVHVEGPDDIIAAVDRAEAETRASEINLFAECVGGGVVRASVIEWPYEAAGHAAQIARDERWDGVL